MTIQTLRLTGVIAAISVSVLILVLNTASTHADNQSFAGQFKDAWLTGRVETVLALNEHLNPYSISTKVENGIVTLSGEVATPIAKALASELIEGIEGVGELSNELIVNEALALSMSTDQIETRRNFSRWVDDATTSAIIRTKLVASRDVSGLDISVQTNADVVTLSGEVNSAAESALAEEIARNTRDVVRVYNNLLVKPVAAN